MKISMFGAGYVGLITGTCLASLGHDVICMDSDREKIKKLKSGIIPIFEPGLKDMVEINAREGRLNFTDEPKEAVQKSDVLFITVGTPPDKGGKADLKYVYQVAENIGKYMDSYKAVIDKSTVPVGTADRVKEIIKKSQKEKYEFDLVANPEFLREGEAIKDFMNPDRIVIGVDNGKAKDIMLKLYQGIERTGKPILVTDIKSAELIKYASNAMLALRISFMNQLSELCEKIGADIKMVSKGIGLDSRIGPRFLQAGIGYGGSCFPKDVKALAETLKEHGCNYELLDAVETINERQKRHVIPKIQGMFPDLKGKKIAVWGLAFKPKTDDMREAPSITIIKELQQLGAKIKAFDPVAIEESKKHLANVEYSSNPYEAIKDCNALVICTEWDEFRALDLQAIKTLLKEPNIIDGRNIYEPNEMKGLGFNYMGVGRQ